MSDGQKPVVIATHDGMFHADEVCACSVRCSLHEISGRKAVLIRTRDEAVWQQADELIDVGRVYDPQTLRFDHHGAAEEVCRRPGKQSPRASFGLVWKHSGKELVSALLNQLNPSVEIDVEHIVSVLDQSFVQWVDYLDLSGRAEYPVKGAPLPDIVRVISRMNVPAGLVTSDPASLDQMKRLQRANFCQAVTLAKAHLRSEITDQIGRQVERELLRFGVRVGYDGQVAYCPFFVNMDALARRYPKVALAIHTDLLAEETVVRIVGTNGERRMAMPTGWQESVEMSGVRHVHQDISVHCDNMEVATEVAKQIIAYNRQLVVPLEA